MTSALIHVDWTIDGKNLLVVSESYELLFFDVENGDLVNASQTKDW